MSDDGMTVKAVVAQPPKGPSRPVQSVRAQPQAEPKPTPKAPVVDIEAVARQLESFLKNVDPNMPMLGDCETWDDLEAFGSIIVGSPKTVRERLWQLIEEAQIGNFLIQFHFGNMKDNLARKSMRLFASEVAPALRRDSADLFARNFPVLGDTAGNLAMEGAAQ